MIMFSMYIETGELVPVYWLMIGRIIVVLADPFRAADFLVDFEDFD